MLKFPIGWAKVSAGLKRIPASSNMAATNREPLIVIAFPAVGHPARLLVNFLECPLGQSGMEDMEVRIRRQSACEKLFRFRRFAQALIDHSRMEKELGILGSLYERLVDRVARFFKSPVLIKCPGQDVVPIDVFSY